MGEHSMNPHILIIDADASAAYITRACVQRVAPKASCTIEPGTPNRIYDAHSPLDLVIVDPPCHSPAGLRLVRTLKETHPQAHVIVLTSAPTPMLRRDMQLMGVDAYLEKPAPLAELVAALRTSLPCLDLNQAQPLTVTNANLLKGA